MMGVKFSREKCYPGIFERLIQPSLVRLELKRQYNSPQNGIIYHIQRLLVQIFQSVPRAPAAN